MNDMMAYIIRRACKIYGGADGTFTAATFANAISKITGVKTILDGNIVEAILLGRDDVMPLPGESHYKYCKKYR